MFHLVAAPTRLSQRLAGARTRRAASVAHRALLAADRTPRGETFAIGLGCDGWKPRRQLG